MTSHQVILRVRGAIAELQSFPIRSAIGILSVATGASCIVVVTSLSLGLQQAVGRSFESSGQQVVIVRSDPSYDSIALGTDRGLNERDMRQLRGIARGQIIAPLVRFGGFNSDIQMGNLRAHSVIYGTTKQYFSLPEVHVVAGFAPSTENWKSGDRHCLIGRTVQRDLGAGLEIVGKTIYAAGQSCKVIGVVTAAGSALSFDGNRLVIAPVSFAEALNTSGKDNDIEIHVGLPQNVDVEAASEIIAARLRHARNSPPGEDDFLVVTGARVRRYINDTTAKLRLGMYGFAFVVFAVAGLGISNIMLSGVVMRRSEIGLKRAIGATRSVIYAELLLEAILITVAGGVAGISLGVFASLAITSLSSYFGESTVSLLGCVAAAATTLATGAIAGVFPAMKAARMNPIDALRAN